MNKIQVHQALYGEVNRAHSCIHQTIDDPELTSFLIRFTDRPGPLPPGIELKPYISGSSFGDYYIFSKTFPDPYVNRSGMVITHCLIIEIDALREINLLEDIFIHFITQAPEVKNSLFPLEIDLKSSGDISEKTEQPVYIQKVLSSFIKGELPILFSGHLDSFENVLQKLWNSPSKALRDKIKFRVSFTPSDISNSDDLTIFLIQKELLPKWQSGLVINDDNPELVEITSHSEKLFLGDQKENPFYIFLESLGANFNDLNTYIKGDLLYSDFVSLENLDDPNILRRDLRILAKLSPSKNSGKKIKSKFTEKLKELVNSGLETNAKGLRNIKWDSYDQGEEIGEVLVAGIIEKSLNDLKQQKIEQLVEIVHLSIHESNKNWWHFAVENAFKTNSKFDEAVIQKNIWSLLLYSKESANNISSFLNSDKLTESLLRKYLPSDIKKANGKEILPILQNKKWYLLHAEILQKIYALSKAVEQQLTIEKTLPFKNSIGVKYLIEKIGDEELLKITLESCDEKLLKQLTDRILKNASLLKQIDLKVSCWLDIWTRVLDEKKDFQYGIKGKEEFIVFDVLDLVAEGSKIQEIIFDLISKTEFSDISNYKNRQSIWKFIPASAKGRFIESTTQSVMQSLLQDSIEASSIESVLRDYITSTEFMTSFLELYKSNIDPVLKIFESFSNLPDRFLSDYIYYYKTQITEQQSERLGNIILQRNFTTSARNVYEKSRYYNSFSQAYEICKSLVKLSWWESLWVNPSHKPDTYYKNIGKPKKEAIKSIELLPTIVILTAIQEEYRAVKSFLKEVVEADHDDTSYEVGIFNLYNRDIAKVIIRECGAKNSIASQETERAIRNFQPQAIFFVGIAGSRKPNDFLLGDVIFPDKIYSYEGGKSEEKTFSARPDLAGTSFTLYEIAKKERRKEDWKSIIKNEHSQKVKADLGVIASGEKLVEHYESDIGRILTDHYNDTSAVEMEGFGFAKAATRQGRSSSQMMIGVVRGISDIIEQPNEKKTESKNDRRPENAKVLASDTAAAFAYWLIFKAFL